MLPDDSWSTADDINYQKTLPIHICTRDDLPNFYQANNNFVGAVSSMFTKMYCPDDVSQINLWGNFNTDFNKIFYIQVSLCKPSKTKKCQPTSKISQWPYLVTLTNNQVYQSNEFEPENIILNDLQLNWMNIATTSPT